MAIPDILRDELIEHVVGNLVDNMSTKDLIQYFIDTQAEILSEASDEELLEYAEDYSTDEEWVTFQEALAAGGSNA